MIRTLEIDLREERRTLQVDKVQSKSVQSRMVQLDRVDKVQSKSFSTQSTVVLQVVFHVRGHA